MTRIINGKRYLRVSKHRGKRNAEYNKEYMRSKGINAVIRKTTDTYSIYVPETHFTKSELRRGIEVKGRRK